MGEETIMSVADDDILENAGRSDEDIRFADLRKKQMLDAMALALAEQLEDSWP